MRRDSSKRDVIRARAVASGPIEDDTVLGAARETPVWLAASLHDVARNVVLGWPVPVLLAGLVLVSAFLLQREGTVVDFGDGVYRAILALHGDAIADPQHSSPLVRGLTVVDWFGGLVLLSTFIWLVTVSFDHGRAESKRHQRQSR